MLESALPGEARGFPRCSRLHDSGDFQRALRGSRTQGRWVVVSSSPGGVSRSRLGIVVGRRTVRSAVDRNWIKRTVREAFRTLEGRRVLDVVVRVRTTPDKQHKHALRAEVRHILARVLC